MVGFLNSESMLRQRLNAFIIACFVGAALWQDGVLKLWDMVTGEELMTKAISQMTKDQRWHFRSFFINSWCANFTLYNVFKHLHRFFIVHALVLVWHAKPKTSSD